jgi:hypothetical protein
MHHAYDMLETSVFRGGKNPPRRLQLMYLTQSLQPGMVDELPLCHLAGYRPLRKWYVAM